jgi:hypothetical protein
VNAEFSNLLGGDTTAQTSYFESRLTHHPNMAELESKHRTQNRSPNSTYFNIPTKNVKFEKFIEVIFKSRMQAEDIKDEIIKYMQALETSYNEAIKDLRK